MIDPAFWQSETVAALPIELRYFFIGLFSNADDQGRMKAHPALIRSQVYPFDDIELEHITAQLESLTSGDFIIPYSVDDRAYLQVKNWWKYQRPRWARPSEHPTPEGWQDRICYRKGNAVVKSNWDESDANPPTESDTSEPTVESERPHSEPTPSPAPRGRGRGRGRDSGRDRGSEDRAANAAPPPPPATKKAKTKPKRAKPPPPPAIARYRSVARLYPEKSLWADIAEVVGEDEADLDRWEKTVKAWIACGWNKRNVKGMMQFYVEKKLPGDEYQQRNKGSPAPEPKGFAAIRAMMEKEGMTDGQQI